MPGQPTSRSEMSAVVRGAGAEGTERLARYNISISDPREGSASGLLVRDGIPSVIDGHKNDDMYRRSSHLYSEYGPLEGSVDRDSLLESSLARQLDSKKDQPAIIRLIRRRSVSDQPQTDSMEPNVPWVNLIPPNTKFFLQQVQESREEKVQVIDTFGEWIAFFFGRRPEVYTYTGTLLNASNHNWKNEFQENYDNFLRGSQAVKNRATIILQYDDVAVEGYMLSSSTTQTAESDNGIPFQFNLLVIDRSPINPRKLMAERFARSGGTLAEGLLFDELQNVHDLTKDNRINELESFLIMREYFSGNYVPNAGIVSKVDNTNSISGSASVLPGTNSGISAVKQAYSSFESSLTNAYESIVVLE